VRKKVYVAGPYTKGDPAVNTRNAVLVGNAFLREGLVPFVPHLNYLWQMVSPREYEEWMTYCFEWLGVCDALYRMAGDSPGADREVAEAERLGIPVFHSTAEVIRWSRT